MTDPNFIYDRRRLTHRLLQYWHDKRGIRALPEENDIDPDELGEDWDFCFLLQARDVFNIQDYNFTYLGSNILKAYFDRALDEHNEYMVGPNAYHLSSHFTNVLESRAPVLDEGEFTTIHAHKILYRQVLLPLGDADGEVTAIFGGMSYKLAD